MSFRIRWAMSPWTGTVVFGMLVTSDASMGILRLVMASLTFRDAAGAIAFVHDGFKLLSAQLAGAFGDGFFNGVLGHIHSAGFVDDVAEVEVVARIAAAGAGGDDDLAGDLAPDLAALGVVGAFG